MNLLNHFLSLSWQNGIPKAAYLRSAKGLGKCNFTQLSEVCTLHVNLCPHYPPTFWADSAVLGGVLKGIMNKTSLVWYISFLPYIACSLSVSNIPQDNHLSNVKLWSFLNFNWLNLTSMPAFYGFNRTPGFFSFIKTRKGNLKSLTRNHTRTYSKSRRFEENAHEEII